MILIGQYDSPFTRRVGIALTLYGMAFEHRPWSTFGDADRLQPLNPLIRVPTLVLDDGFVLIDSHMILDYLDTLVPDDVAMFPRAEPARHLVLKATTLATGLAEKAVGLFYERLMHDKVSETWQARCRRQITSVLQALEADRASRSGPFWFDRLSHADIAAACALRFTGDAHPEVDLSLYPHLQRDAAKLEATPAFRRIFQRFIPPS
ncbi:MAG: glutathione S-transferase N-terminal domain-containing protein [bacterium]